MLTLNQKSDNFTKLLIKAAEKLNCIFVDDCGEGHDMVTDTLYCEDVSGWLIPQKNEAEFIASNDKHDVKWNNYFVFAEWKENDGEIIIEFKKYPKYDVEEFSKNQTFGQILKPTGT